MPVTKENPDLSVSVTDRAGDKIKFFAEKQGLGSEYGVKVGVKGGGCSGLLYTLSIEKDPDADDKVVEDRGIRVFIPCLLYTSDAADE